MTTYDIRSVPTITIASKDYINFVKFVKLCKTPLLSGDYKTTANISSLYASKVSYVITASTTFIPTLEQYDLITSKDD